MNRQLALMAAAALLALGAQPAMAAASASASLTDLSFSLTALNGNSTSLTWTSAANDYTLATGTNALTMAFDDHAGSPSTLGMAGASASADASGTAYTALASAGGGPAGAQFSNGWAFNNGIYFTLSGETTLEITGTTAWSGASNAALDYAQAYIYGYASAGDVSASASLGQSCGGICSFSTAATPQGFDLVLSNTGAAAVRGYFFGYARANAYSYTSPVAEPSSLPLMAAGLGALLFVARRRKSA
jgi:hypothetical protein